jgi:hypothetical protein
MSTHRIETLRVELAHRSARSASGGQELHRRLMSFLRREGFAAIEACFEDACPAGEVWVLPRLTLDLGALDRHQSEAQWRERLTASLWGELARAARSGAGGAEGGGLGEDGDVHPALAIRREGADRHEIGQFLHYLRHGQLPWGLNLHGRRALSGWLAGLAVRHGAALWRALQQDPARDRLLARLSAISPHDGLQALIAQRDERLAGTLARMDDEVLLPLQGRGRLSAYQRARLQQALRAAALTQLWDARGAGLGGRGRRALLAAWRALIAGALGGGWREAIGGLASAAPPHAAGTVEDAVHAVRSGGIAALLAGGDTNTPIDREPEGDAALSPGRTWEQALLQLQALLRQRRPGQEERLRHLLTQLAASHPLQLRRRLRGWALQRRERRAWSLALAPAGMALVLTAMSPRPAPGLGGSARLHWAESLRQAALRLQAEAPASRRPGLGRLQALLMQASLRHLVEGHRLPDQHSGWLSLWRRAWLDWERGEFDPAPQAEAIDRPRPAEPAATRGEAAPPPRRRGADGGADVGTEGGAGIATDATSRALLHLERDCRAGRWRWPQRLRLARLLETPLGCERWLRLFTEERRWHLLQAQFGALTAPLRQRAGRLASWLRGLVREPAAALAEHWRRLCHHLFIRGLSPDAASLRRHYQDELPPEPAVLAVAPASAPARATERQPVWVDDAGQVLLAAYAERLFKHLRLVDNGRFVDDSARAVGVQCLQALCHGPEPAPPDESCTALSRLLCGVSPHEVLPVPEPLGGERLTLLEQLLGAVIAHWSAVGRTSVAGLRESFLQRQGRLWEEAPRGGDPARWRLRVQTRGFDVLLDRLPWSFHTIRLPWMQGALHVEWR